MQRARNTVKAMESLTRRRRARQKSSSSRPHFCAINNLNTATAKELSIPLRLFALDLVVELLLLLLRLLLCIAPASSQDDPKCAPSALQASWMPYGSSNNNIALLESRAVCLLVVWSDEMWCAPDTCVCAKAGALHPDGPTARSLSLYLSLRLLRKFLSGQPR